VIEESERGNIMVQFFDGFKVSIGDTVGFYTRHGSSGHGEVIGFSRSRGATTVLVKPNEETRMGSYDRWPLKDGGFYSRLESEGLFGGEILRK
jgi:hypothetical protein